MVGSLRKHCGHGLSTCRLLWASLKFLAFLSIQQVGGFECSVGQQQQILDSVVRCSTGGVMLDLRQLILASNSSGLGVPVEEVVQVVPDTVAVSRCKGGCNLPAHSCHPTQVAEREVEVMLVLARWPQGEHQVVCSSVQVEDHLACGCGCAVKPEHCSQRHYYQESTCRCLCRHTEERAVCIESGRTWDHNSCSCNCPRHTWTSCSTGYVFDYSSSCSCVLISALASQGLLPALLLLTLALLVLLGGVVALRRRRQLADTVKTRTPLMSQISVAEYEIRESSLEMSSPETITNIVHEGTSTVRAAGDTKHIPSPEFKSSDQLLESDVNLLNIQNQNENAQKTLQWILPTNADKRRSMITSVRENLGGEQNLA